MREATLKNRLGVLLIVGHLSVVALLLILYFLGGFTFDEMTTSVALVSPLFVAYTTSIIAFFVATRHVSQDSSPTVTTQFIYLSLALPLAFIGTLLIIIFLKAWNLGISSFEQFKQIFGIIEVLFGIYVGVFLKTLFGEVKSGTSEPPANP